MTRLVVLDKNGSGRAFLDLLESLFKGPVVPRAGIEPALLSEPHFECGASTSSANGAHEEDEDGLYHGLMHPRKVAGLDHHPFDLPRTGGLQYFHSKTAEDAFAQDSVEGSQEGTRPHYTRYLTPRQIRVEDWIKNDAHEWVSELGPHADFAALLLQVWIDTDLPNGWTCNPYYDTRGYFYLQVEDPNGTCNVTGQPDPWKGRKWLVSPHMTRGELVQTFFKATMTAVEHEVREQFTYKCQPIFDPHYNVDRLVDLRAEKSALVHRA